MCKRLQLNSVRLAQKKQEEERANAQEPRK